LQQLLQPAAWPLLLPLHLLLRGTVARHVLQAAPLLMPLAPSEARRQSLMLTLLALLLRKILGRAWAACQVLRRHVEVGNTPAAAAVPPSLASLLVAPNLGSHGCLALQQTHALCMLPQGDPLVPNPAVPNPAVPNPAVLLLLLLHALPNCPAAHHGPTLAAARGPWHAKCHACRDPYPLLLFFPSEQQPALMLAALPSGG
jgi:hypothetical protein